MDNEVMQDGMYERGQVWRLKLQKIVPLRRCQSRGR